MRKVRQIVFTQEGYDKLKKEREEILAQRKGAVENLRQARELGDLSENGFYKAAKARLRSMDSNLSRIGAMLRLGIIQKAPDTGVVGVGSTVTIHDGERERVLQIVGEYEADPANGKISINSPIGKAALRKKVNDEVIIETPKGRKKFVIKKIIS